MLAFAAVLWNHEDVNAAEEARALRAKIEESVTHVNGVARQSGVCMYDLSSRTNKSQLLELRGKNAPSVGVLFGTLFRQSAELRPAGPISTLTDTDLDLLCNTSGQSLISQFWGNYVCILNHAGAIKIIAAPSSAIPSYFLRKGRLTIVFSHLEKCPFLRATDLTFNMRLVSALLAYDKIQSGETGFNEIQELLGGQSATIADGKVTVETLWDPHEFANDLFAPSLADAAHALRETTRYVVQSWASAFSKIGVSLSGGLDSTIVLQCLGSKNTDLDIRAFHNVYDSDDPSEAEYARLAAESAGCQLVERHFSSNSVLPDLHSHPLSVRPCREFLKSNMNAAFEASPADRDRPVFTGQGGDHLFYARRSILGFADSMRIRGICKETWEELLWSAKLSEQSIWTVLRKATPAALFGAQSSGFAHSISGVKTPLNEHLHERLKMRDYFPSWASSPNGLAPGKFDQVSSIAHLFMARQAMDSPISQHVVHPLVSQPLIELCLRVPVYLLTWRGVSRGLARESFKHDIPSRISKRMTKGETSRFAVELVTNGFENLREAVLYGALAEEGLVAPSAASDFCTADQIVSRRSGFRLLIYYAIEAWFRRWKIAMRDTATVMS